MNIFLGLFTNLDLVIKDYRLGGFKGIEPLSPSKEILSEPGEVLHILKQEGDSEHLITKELFEFLKKRFKGKRKIGGNAGNAAMILSELGIPCVLSCPSRPETIMDMLGRYKGVRVVREGCFISPPKAAKSDSEFEHLSFEKEGYRKIFTFDPVSFGCVLDEDFWEKINSADLLWLCGFHLVSEKYKHKVDVISDMLEEAGCKIHLELGDGTETVRYAISKFVDSGVLHSLGMNEIETKFIGFKGDPLEHTDFFSEFMKAGGLERLTIHSKEYRLTFFRKDREKNMKAGEESVRISAARAFGNIRENLERISKLKRYRLKRVRGKNFILIPAYVTPKPKVITGLGDTCSIVDAVISLGENLNIYRKTTLNYE